MNALLTLQPRAASDDTIGPDIEFTDHRDELHGLPVRCEVGTTRICVA